MYGTNSSPQTFLENHDFKEIIKKNYQVKKKKYSNEGTNTLFALNF